MQGTVEDYKKKACMFMRTPGGRGEYCLGDKCAHWYWEKRQEFRKAEGDKYSAWHDLPEELCEGRCGLVSPSAIAMD